MFSLLQSGRTSDAGAAKATPIAPEIRARIDEIWEQRKILRCDDCYNGQLFSIHHLTSDRSSDG